MEKFSDTLSNMTLPEVTQLKHQGMLEKELIKSKDKLVVNWWWISIPLYLIATLFMKRIFMPSTSLLSNMKDYINKENSLSLFFFLIVPIVSIIINIISIRKIYSLTGHSGNVSFLKMVWFNVVIMLASVIILIIYSL